MSKAPTALAPAPNPEFHHEMAFLRNIGRCQDLVARFSMERADFIEYEKLMGDFLDHEIIPYEDFREGMVKVLEKPHYDELRIFFDIVHRRLKGEPQENGFLIYYPAVNFMLFYSCLTSAQMLGRTAGEYPVGLNREQCEYLGYHWQTEWVRLGNRRYHRFFRKCQLLPGTRRTVEPEIPFRSDDFVGYLYKWNELHAARVLASPEYNIRCCRTLLDFIEGRKTYDDFQGEMRALL